MRNELRAFGIDRRSFEIGSLQLEAQFESISISRMARRRRRSASAPAGRCCTAEVPKVQESRKVALLKGP